MATKKASKEVSKTTPKTTTTVKETTPTDVHYGGFWIRFVAALLDGIILGIPNAILQFSLMWGTGSVALSYIPTIAIVVLTIYLDGNVGGTPGKLILGLRIVNEQGTTIGIPRAILRYIGKIVSGMILLIGYIMIGFTQKKQGLHDMIASTYVVYK